MVKRAVIYSERRWSADAKQYEPTKTYDAIFHQFGIDYEEMENGPGMFSVAIIELPAGEVKMVRADKIKFTETT